MKFSKTRQEVEMAKSMSDDYYLKIAQSLNSIIPIQWTRIMAGFEMIDEVVTIFFYYFDKNEEKYYPEGTLVEEHGVNAREFHELLVKLSDYVIKLNGEMEDKTGVSWSTMAFILESTGEFNVDYGYDDLTLSSKIERRRKWMEKYSVK